MRRFSLAFYLNALAMVLFFLAVMISRRPWHVALQWLAGGALLCGIVLLVLHK